jgi:tRNA threonylcarbamoyl adenosine modification protein YeaZ
MTASSFLALDTATDRPSFALGGAERVLAHRHDLSREIDGAVRALLAEAGVAAAALGGVVVSDGPGSFTGLRIGIAFAKGFCRAAGIPMLAVPSMLGAAWRVHLSEDPVVVEYEALRGDVYRAVYRFDGTGVVTVEPPRVTPRTPTPAGDLRASEGDASAAALLGVMALHGAALAVADPGAWEPSYGRLAEAEARLNARNAAR